MNITSRVLALAVAALTTGGVAACSTSAANDSSANNSSSPGMKGGTLTIGVDAVPPTIDQAVYPGQSARWAHIQYEATLLMYKPLPRDATTLQDPTKLTGNLATSWTVSPDGITVKLRKAKASNGDVLTAKDVAWTFDREVALKDGVGEFYLGLAGINPDKPVTVVNNNTVKFNGHITPLGLVPLMADQFAIIDSKQAKAHATHSDPWATDWLKTHSAGYGPYDVSSFQPKQKLTLTANPNYWHGPPGYNKVVMTPTTVQTAPQLLRSGTIEYQIEVGLAQFAKLKKQGSLKMYAAPSLSQDVLELNKKSGPLANVNVRRAMSMAINRKALVQGPYHRVGKPAVSVINTSIPGITGTSPYYSYDLKKAKSLLATTPYKDGFTLNLTATQAEVSSVDISSLAVNLASQLAPLGIKVKVNTIASDADFTAARKADKLQAWLRKESPAVADAVYLMQLIHVTGANSNYTHESNPAIDALVKKASVQEFGPARNKPINKAVALWNKKMPDIPLVQLKNTFGFAKSVCGIAPSSTQEISASTLHPC